MSALLQSEYASYVLSAWGIAMFILFWLTASSYWAKRRLEKQLLRRQRRAELAKQDIAS